MSLNGFELMPEFSLLCMNVYFDSSCPECMSAKKAKTFQIVATLLSCSCLPSVLARGSSKLGGFALGPSMGRAEFGHRLFNLDSKFGQACHKLSNLVSKLNGSKLSLVSCGPGMGSRSGRANSNKKKLNIF